LQGGRPMAKNITETCKSCGGETVPDVHRTGSVLPSAQREVALARELSHTEELRERAECRARELEQAVRAFLKGKVKAEVLGQVVEAGAY
jgi:hypothetical protein